MPLNAFRQQALATALTSPRQSGASAFSAHPGAKSMLAFAGAFGGLKCAFHNNPSAGPGGSGMLG
jgi:hypothetical protein